MWFIIYYMMAMIISHWFKKHINTIFCFLLFALLYSKIHLFELIGYFQEVSSLNQSFDICLWLFKW